MREREEGWGLTEDGSGGGEGGSGGGWGLGETPVGMANTVAVAPVGAT